MLKLEYFYYVIEISKIGSINRAAQNLYISQPYLSLSLKKTEDTLGIKVFHRTSKGVTPTIAGKEFIEYSKKIIELINKSHDLKNKYSNDNQKFSITSMPSFTILDLIQDFKDYCESKYDSCQIFYDEVPNTYIAEKVMKGSTDIGIVYTNSNNHELELKNFKDMSLEFFPLITEPLCAVVSTKNKLYNKDEITLKDLKELSFLVETVDLFKNRPPVENNPFPEIFNSETGHHLKFNNNRSLLHYLLKRDDSFCIGQKSLNMTTPSVISGDLKYIPISDLNLYLTTGYLRKESLETSSIEESFIDSIYDLFENIKNKSFHIDI